MRKKTGKLVLCLNIVLVFLLLTIPSGFAADATVPALPADAGYSLTLSLNEKSSGPNGTKEIPISGAELTAMKVADLSVTDGFANYSSIPAFAALSVEYNGMTTNQSNKVAASMSKMIADSPADFAPEKGITTMKGVTDASGKVKFSGDTLTPGMYLIRETNRTGKALDYEIIKPYLVSVPEYCAGEWIAAVEAEPKMEPVKVPPTTTSTTTTTTRTTTKPAPPTTTKPPVVTRVAKWVNTGDGTRIVTWTAILLVSALAMFILNRKRHDEDPLKSEQESSETNNGQ